MPIIKISKKRGIATLLTVMVIGIMALAIIVSIASVASNELVISQGSAQSSSSLFFAESGIRDALIRIARNKNYTCAMTDCYQVDFVTNGCSASLGCAKVSVSAASGDATHPKIIISKGTFKTSTRTLQVNVTLDNGTTTPSLQNGEITSTTWTELTN